LLASMNGQHPQHEFQLDAGPSIHRLDGAEIMEFPVAFNYEESTGYFDYLRDNIAWQGGSIRIAGRRIAIPRLQCWVADPGLSYTYSGIRLQPAPWLQPLQEIRSRVETLAGQSFNAVLLNLYRDGTDSVAWHADDEPELGSNPVVASVSFGACRPFDLKPRLGNGGSKTRILLRSGTVLVMGKTIQNRYLHQLPKVKNLSEPRINLTFRQLLR